MVPGITERDRLVADAQRLEWLADAYLGPARIADRSRRPLGSGARPALFPGLSLNVNLSQHILTFAKELLRRLRSLEPGVSGSRANIAKAPGR